jgi:hypothetical protein
MNVDPTGHSIIGFIVGFLIAAYLTWEIGKGYTNGQVGKDEYYTTVTWFGLEINTFYYTIDKTGYIKFYFDKNPNFNFGSWFYSDVLAEGMYEQARTIHPNGRSVGGIQLELIMHHLGTKVYPEGSEFWKRAAIVDIGSFNGENDPNDLASEVFSIRLNLQYYVLYPFRWLARRFY